MRSSFDGLSSLGESVEVLLLAREPLHLRAQQIPSDGPHPRAGRCAGLEFIQMPVGEDKRVMRHLIDQMRRRRAQGQKRPHRPQVPVEQRGTGVRVAFSAT